MKKTLLVLVVAASAGLLVGCAHEHKAAAIPQATTAGVTAAGIGYDDRQIAKIQRGTTAEAQLLEWFGLPESREMRPDGRSNLTWTFPHRTDGGAGTSGALNVNLSPDGTVEAYAARGGPGPNSPSAGSFAYDDQRVAQIRRGQTTGGQLVDWFGPAQSRQVGPDGRTQLAWSFSKQSNRSAGKSGELHASLAPDETVDAYSARRGRE